MKRRALIGWTAAAGAGALLAAGLVQAQSQPQEDPIGQILQQAPPAEEAPPAPGEVVAPSPAAPAAAAPADTAAEEAASAEAAPLQEIPPPGPRRRHQAAIVRMVDKITAEAVHFEIQVQRPTRYKGLVFTLRACETTAGDEPVPDAAAYLEIRAEPRTVTADQQPSRLVHRGWMFAGTPGLNPLEHPLYDAWLISCRTPAPVTAG